MENNNYICVGKIVNTHGLNGEIKLYPYLNDMDDYKKINTVILASNEDGKSIQNNDIFNILKMRYQKNMILMTVENIDNIEDAQRIKNYFVYAKKEDIEEEDGFFYSDVIGFLVVDKNLGVVGTVLEVYSGAAQDIFIIQKNNDNNVNSANKTFMIPSVKQFIKSFDWDNKIVNVELIDGMLE